MSVYIATVLAGWLRKAQMAATEPAVPGNGRSVHQATIRMRGWLPGSALPTAQLTG